MWEKILPLETNSECLIAQIDKLEIVNDTLYILDRQQDIIFVFDKTGKYLTKIDKKGRGPKEYITVSDFHVDDGLIYISAGSNRKVMCYDLKGDLKKSFNTEYNISNITTDSNYIYVYYNFSLYKDRYNVGVYDKKSNRLFKRYKPYPKQQAGIGYSKYCWISCNDKVYASFPYEYNIYELTPDTCHTIVNIDYGEKYMFPKEWHAYSSQQVEEYRGKTGGIFNSPVIYDCSSLFVTPQRIIFTFVYKCMNNICIINRKDNRIKYGVLWPNEYYWNVHGLAPAYVSDEYIVKAESAASVVSSLQIMGNIPERAEEWALNIKEEDNPCLYFYKLKN